MVFQQHEKLLLSSLFLPFYMCAGVILFLTMRLMWTGEIQNAYHRDPINRLLFFFYNIRYQFNIDFGGRFHYNIVTYSA